MFEEMNSASKWLAQRADFELASYRGRRYWLLRYSAVVQGRRRRGTIVVGLEHETELLRRARLVLKQARINEVLRTFMVRSLFLTGMARSRPDHDDELI